MIEEEVKSAVTLKVADWVDEHLIRDKSQLEKKKQELIGEHRVLEGSLNLSLC